MDVTRANTARKNAVRVSWGITALMAVQALIGLLYPAVYRDPDWILAAWFGCDVVTLAAGVPLMLSGLLGLRRGSVRAELAWFAGLAYGVYNYGYFALGAHLNPLFPVFVSLFVASVTALILGLSSADIESIGARFGSAAPVRMVAGYMGFTGLGLAIAWLAQWAAYVFAGTEPSVGEAPFRLVAAMDLSFMVPTMLVGCVLLWRRRAWGFVIAVMTIVQGATYTAGLTIASIVGGLRGVAGSMEQAPVWGAWTLVGAAAAIALLARMEAGVRHR